MKYLGGKSKIAKQLLNVILPHRLPGQIWVEPFVGAAGLFRYVANPRIGYDANGPLVSLLRAVRGGWVPPENVTELEYRSAKAAPTLFSPELLAFIAIGCSFGGKWFGGYARTSRNGDKYRNYAAESKRSLLEMAPVLRGAHLDAAQYQMAYIPAGSIVYCDPPYKGTTGYLHKIDHTGFWEWCRTQCRDNECSVFVSEYEAPPDYLCAAAISHRANIRHEAKGDRIDRLFIWDQDPLITSGRFDFSVLGAP